MAFSNKKKKFGLKMGKSCLSVSLQGLVQQAFAEAEAARVQPPGWTSHHGELVEAHGHRGEEPNLRGGAGGDSGCPLPARFWWVRQPRTADTLVLSPGSSSAPGCGKPASSSRPTWATLVPPRAKRW